MSRSPHINQPGGVFRESVLKNARGRERELRSLADAVRRLIHVTVTNTASREETAEAARQLHELADRLEPGLPAERTPRYADIGEPSEPHDYFLYDCVLGLYNPLALPVEMEWDPPRALGRARFTTAYEGPPGCVHGAVLAAVFDQIFNIANLMSRTAGPTRELSLTYRRPTPLEADLLFEAQVEEYDGRRIVTTGRATHRGVVTVEARGLFIELPRDHVLSMADWVNDAGGSEDEG